MAFRASNVVPQDAYQVVKRSFTPDEFQTGHSGQHREYEVK